MFLDSKVVGCESLDLSEILSDSQDEEEISFITERNIKPNLNGKISVKSKDFKEPWPINPKNLLCIGTHETSLTSLNSNIAKLNSNNEPNLSNTLGDIECLTSTMLGSWFQKYNRHGKGTKMRFFWINPYSRTLIYAKKPASHLQKTFLINSIQWTESPVSSGTRNFFRIILRIKFSWG